MGLDEIRFNVVHQNYNVDKLKNAVGIIRNVTVEIPAIPEDFDKLKMMTSILFDLGVNYLNLHQLRLNPYNFNNIINRPYTYNHGTKVTILESEFTALELIKYTIKNEIFLPINYCS